MIDGGLHQYDVRARARTRSSMTIDDQRCWGKLHESESSTSPEVVRILDGPVGTRSGDLLEFAGQRTLSARGAASYELSVDEERRNTP